jgi:N-6 DNA Methylase
MATKNKTIPYLASASAAVQEIIKRLDRSRASTYMHTYEHFSRALGVWESVLRLDPMAQWLEATRGLEFNLEPLAEALAILMEQAAQNYYDLLGGVYMQLGQGDKRFGQYFTPWNVAKMMAEMTLADGFKPPGPGEPPLTFYEPCVGSGVMILAAAETIEERFPGTIARGGVEFYGMDLDPCCIAMCRLNMKLHGIGRVVQRFEDLTLPQRRMLERLLGRSLPHTGKLVDAPDIRPGDTLLDLAEPLQAADTTDDTGQESVREPARSDAEVVGLVVEGEQVEPGPDTEMIPVPTLVAQDLWAALETGNGEPAVQNQPPVPRRKGGRATTRQPAEYTPGQLFPPQQDE